jgi:hypothetical protein
MVGLFGSATTNHWTYQREESDAPANKLGMAIQTASETDKPTA